MSICRSMRLTCLSILLSVLGCGGDRTNELIAQLQDGDVGDRRAAVEALVICEGEQVTAALASAIEDSDTDVRRLAINALGQRRSRDTSQLSSIESALEDPQLSVRLAAALAIQKIEPDNETFIPVLIDALRSGEGGIFLEVAEMGPDAKWAVPTLTRLLSHPETKIRALTAYTLGQLGPIARDAEAALTRALKDPQDVVRSKAEQALEQIQSELTTEE